MEQLLGSQHKTTIDSYELFVADSERDLRQTEEELRTLQNILEQEQRRTAVLENEKKINAQELERLGSNYNTLEKELNTLTYNFDQKQNELDKLRTQAGEDARKLAVELGKAQSETNVLILELKKYEGLAKFMDLERDLILKAQADAKGMNPAITSQDIEEAEERREMLENEIAAMTQEWQEKLSSVRDEAEKVLNEVEIKEFQTRIAVLMKELDDKNKEIETVTE